MRSLATLPGPRTPTLLNMLEFGLAPERFAARHARNYGRYYRIPGPGGTQFLVTADPAHIRNIFAAGPDVFRSFSEVSLRHVFGRHSVLLASGSAHTRLRKMLSPPLTGSRLRAFGTIMQDLADLHVGALRPGQQLLAHDLSTAFTLQVIARCVFGADEHEDSAELRGMLSGLVHSIPALPIFLPKLQHDWFPPWAKYQRLRRHFERWMRAKIGERRRDGSDRGDVLSLLLAVRYDDGSVMDDADISDQLVTLLLAGHETTAITLATCLNRLLRNQTVLETLRQELATNNDLEALQRLPYLSAVIDESLRLDPVVTDVARLPVVPFVLDGDLVVEPGDAILVLIEALHRDPALYPNPGCFEPERFLARKPTPFEYLPFGGGVRRCLGAAFSDYETKILLSTLLRRVDLSLTDMRPEPRVRRNITMGPKRGVPIRIDALR